MSAAAILHILSQKIPHRDFKKNGNWHSVTSPEAEAEVDLPSQASCPDSGLR